MNILNILTPEAIAIIAAAVISLIGMIFVCLVNVHQQKHEALRRFFYEMYPKRIALYEDIIKELIFMGSDRNSFFRLNLTKADIIEKIDTGFHSLVPLRARLDLYGSTTARSLINGFALQLLATKVLLADELSFKGNDDVEALFHLINDTHAKFLEFIRKEAGADIVIKELNKFSTLSKMRNLFKKFFKN